MSVVFFTVVVSMIVGAGISWVFRRTPDAAWVLALLPVLVMAGVAVVTADEYRATDVGIIGISAGVAGFTLWLLTISALVGRIGALERRLGELDGTAKAKDEPRPAWSI